MHAVAEAPVTESRPTSIRPRPSPASFEEPLPRRWFGGLPVPTHLVNAVNLLFPAGERFFVRSVRHYLDHIDDPVLRAQIKGFFGQEGRHAGAHEKFFEVMESHGLEIRDFLERYESIAYGFVEPRVSPELRLAVTVALEHYTAILAEGVFTLDILAPAHPEMQKLLYWHAAEEIEHKSVAFDVLAKVAPSYPLRMAGLALATVGLAGFWAVAFVMLMRQEKALAGGERLNYKRLRKDRSILRDVFLHGIREYMRRDFHPSQKPNDHLAQSFLAREGIA